MIKIIIFLWGGVYDVLCVLYVLIYFCFQILKKVNKQEVCLVVRCVVES